MCEVHLTVEYLCFWIYILVIMQHIGVYEIHPLRILFPLSPCLLPSPPRFATTGGRLCQEAQSEKTQNSKQRPPISTYIMTITFQFSLDIS